MASLYERLGGADAMDAAVDIFYRKVLMDDLLGPFFDDIDMGLQIAKQKAFLTMVTGGPNNYDGRDMREGHKRLVDKGMTDEHVDAVIKHLGETLRELGVADQDIADVAAVAESVRDHVLNR